MGETHRSSFSTAPVLNRQGEQQLDLLYSKDSIDRKILEALGVHNNLTADDLHKLLGCDKTYLYRRLQVLTSLAYTRLSAEQLEEKNVSRKRTFFLAAIGAKWLKAHGKPISTRRTHRGYESHANLTSAITTDLYTGIMNTHDFRYVPSSEVRAHPHFHQPNDEPRNHPVIPHYKSKVIPDTDFFAIESARGMRFLVIEADNGTMTIRPTNPTTYKSATLYKKFEGYLPFIRDSVYNTKYGLPNFWVLFVFTDEARERATMECLRAFNSSAARYVLFQTIQPGAQPGHLFTRPWLRVGHDPLLLNQP